jgi:hypothetical protein
LNYKKIYDALIERGKSRFLVGYYEVHHIIPRCLGGTDESQNLVRLTPEEHYLAHQLLVKIYPNNHKLVKAATMMIPNRPTNKMYGWLRRRFTDAQSISQTGSGNSQYGSRWVHNPQTGESKKIRGLLEEGWLYGRYKIPKNKPPSKKEIKKKKALQLYHKYYKLYAKVGFDKFVEITGYTKSQQNLVQQISKYVNNFVPQNGKKRKLI